MKSWSQVVSGSSNKQREIIEKQIRIQIKDEHDKQSMTTNIIIKGPRDFGENERTDTLTRDFLKDKLKWAGSINQASRIGRKLEGEKDRHVRVSLRSIEDRNMILRNRGLLGGTHIFLDEDLTFAQ